MSCKCSRDTTEAPIQGTSNALCDDSGEEVEDGLFDASVRREIAFKPDEDEVEDESVNHSCDSKYQRSETNSSLEAHCSLTSN